jgi:hypothetical protein
MKKFWDENYPQGREYPARERRIKSKSQPTGSTAPSTSSAGSSSGSVPTKRVTSTSSSLNTSSSAALPVDKENEPLAVRPNIAPTKNTAATKKPAAQPTVARAKPLSGASALKPKQPASQIAGKDAYSQQHC